ncbi:hypothetical protein [Lewinella sp. JB7]|uniref:hypothetical protein n=1 Tax=Lewinella sp. JB7 TaxID=2962887 RepID=UPI0020C99E77|nr:hypothetical protein [Lewinella sp. JB7]MCP9236450.1 hypothetical protein [Lewinella sp. JB7]
MKKAFTLLLLLYFSGEIAAQPSLTITLLQSEFLEMSRPPQARREIGRVPPLLPVFAQTRILPSGSGDYTIVLPRIDVFGQHPAARGSFSGQASMFTSPNHSSQVFTVRFGRYTQSLIQ